MKYRITEEKRGLDVRVDSRGSEGEQVLAVFQRCKEGKCRCPADEIEIESGAEGVTLHLRCKEGARIDGSVIERCVGHALCHLND